MTDDVPADLKGLVKVFDGDLDQLLFYVSWIKNGLNASAAYKELHPEVSDHSARTLGSRALAKVDKQLVMESYGLDLQVYFQQLKEGLEANKQIAGIVINGKVKEADSQTHDFIEVPDHAVRKAYHDKLGRLLGIETDSSKVNINLNQQNNFISLADFMSKMRQRVEAGED